MLGGVSGAHENLANSAQTLPNPTKPATLTGTVKEVLVMAHIRTKAELDIRDLTEAEVKLIEACQKGEHCVLGDGELPPEGTPDPSRHIHAKVLRYLILGGCAECLVDDIGVSVKGAYVTGLLDLDFTTTRGAIRMHNCRFDEKLDLEQTKCRQLALTGSDLQGINAQALKVTGSVFLGQVTTHLEIDLNNATIGGPLVLNGTTFKMKTDRALFAQDAKISGSVFLRGITTHAAIVLKGAEIGASLECIAAKFIIENGRALDVERAKITGGLRWLDVEFSTGSLNFKAAYIGQIVDDEVSWPIDIPIHIDGMTYDRIAGSPTDAKTRLKWLSKCDQSQEEFKPQPYTQLAKVLRDMGHDKDARLVLERREQLLRQDQRKRWRAPANPAKRNYLIALGVDIGAALHWAFNEQALKLLIGYGHRPFKSLVWLFVFWTTVVWLSHRAWEAGDFAPASAVLQASPEWQELAASGIANPAKAWSIPPENVNGTKS
jgi:hypothetical protein